MRYRVVMDATQQRWLYGLSYAESETPGVIEAWDYRLGVINPLETQFGYDVMSWTGTFATRAQPMAPGSRERVSRDSILKPGPG